MTDLWAERIAANIHHLSTSEEALLIHSASRRERVIKAFREMYGEGAELQIAVTESSLSITWKRPQK